MSSRFAERPLAKHRPKGAAIIMAMLTVALVAGLAATILADYSHAVDQLSGRHDQAQARWLARGAIDWARNVLENDYIRGGANRVDHLGEEWAIKVPATPFEEGELSGEIEDLSSRFNLNSLVGTGGKPDPAQVERFKRLLVALGISENQATQLTNSLIDWIDPDDEIRDQRGGSETQAYRQNQGARLPPQAYLLDVNELKSIQGFTPNLVEQLTPHVVALPAASRQINVNTADEIVLQAYVEKLDASQARALVLDRNRSFFTSVENFQQRLPANLKLEASLFRVTSQYFYATGRARWGEAVTRMQVLLERQQARPDILWIKMQ